MAIGLLISCPIWAATLDEAEELYRSGNMLEAARLARASGTTDGFALAAKAGLVDAVYFAPEDHRADALQAAADDAERALEIDPNHVGAMLRLAMVLGHLAELEDPVSAHLKGYAHQGRLLLDRALALAPDDPWANGLLGIWHLQIVEHGGGALAQGFYGASREEGRRLCARALELDPEATAIAFGCARSLLDLNPTGYREAALAAFRQVVAAPAEDVPAKLLRAEAWAEIQKIRRMAAPPASRRSGRRSGAARPDPPAHRRSAVPRHRAAAARSAATSAAA
ncbi:MAG TPA: hypothetical protein VFZ01_04805 [Geminicoccaceae bacterium]